MWKRAKDWMLITEPNLISKKAELNHRRYLEKDQDFQKSNKTLTRKHSQTQRSKKMLIKNRHRKMVHKLTLNILKILIVLNLKKTIW